MNIEKAWSCGFFCGLEFDANVSFDISAEEARYWREGWIQGALRRVGLPHYASPVEQALNQGKPLSPQSELWARKFGDRYFPD